MHRDDDGVVVAEALFEGLEFLELRIVEVEEAGVGEVGAEPRQPRREPNDQDDSKRHRDPRVGGDRTHESAIEARDVELFEVSHGAITVPAPDC